MLFILNVQETEESTSADSDVSSAVLGALSKLEIADETFLSPETRSTTSTQSDVACVAGAWKLWAKERTGAREGDTLEVFVASGDLSRPQS